MKSILLASVATVGFAGAAAADISFSGSATLGYNDTNVLVTPNGDAIDDNNFGFYSDLNLDVAFSMELDYGVTVSAGADVDEVDASDADFGGVWLKIASDTASLTFGDTTFAPEDYWVSAGDMESDGFSAQDGEIVLKGDFTFGAFSAGISYAVADAGGDYPDDNGLDPLDQLGLGLSGSFGNFNVVLAYQEEAQGSSGFYDPTVENGDFNMAQVWGVSVNTTFGAADITLAYADNSVSTSTGVKVSYPVGPVTLTAYYVDEAGGANEDPNYGINAAYENGPIAVALDYQDDQGTQKINIDGSYALDNGLTVYAGARMDDGVVDTSGDTVTQVYVAGMFDLGGGASLLFSYADSGNYNVDDEIGPDSYQEGMTVEASFEF